MRKPFEITVVSGKGGTGKTTVTAALAACLPNKVMVDCDVEAANLSLWLSLKDVSNECFIGGMIAVVDEAKCTKCGLCATKCHFKAITVSDSYHLNKIKCEGCGVCAYVCPARAITLKERGERAGAARETTKGPLVHAHLHPGEGNSGKMVNRVRELAGKKPGVLM
jgi:MinD superfamily P-loop ATPase